jgi:hypothetical protein
MKSHELQHIITRLKYWNYSITSSENNELAYVDSIYKVVFAFGQGRVLESFSFFKMTNGRLIEIRKSSNVEVTNFCRIFKLITKLDLESNLYFFESFYDQQLFGIE